MLETRRSTLWLVRHGESTWNASGLVQGQARGPVLSAKGRREATRLPERLGDIRVGAIYTSDLERARADGGRSWGARWACHCTSTPTCVSGASATPRVARSANSTQRRRVSSSIGSSTQTPGRRPGSPSASCTNACGPSSTELEVREPDGDVLVVTHGGVIRVAEAYCSGIGVDDMTWDPVPNASCPGCPPAPSVLISRAIGSREITARSVLCDQRCCSYRREPASRGPRA